jgi:hypothetical protein
MGRKRKDITPNETDTGGKRQRKKKLATNNPNQHNDLPVQPGQTSPSNQGIQSFSLPKIYPDTPSYMNLILVRLCIYSKTFHILTSQNNDICKGLTKLNKVKPVK